MSYLTVMGLWSGALGEVCAPETLSAWGGGGGTRLWNSVRLPWRDTGAIGGPVHISLGTWLNTEWCAAFRGKAKPGFSLKWAPVHLRIIREEFNIYRMFNAHLKIRFSVL